MARVAFAITNELGTALGEEAVREYYVLKDGSVEDLRSLGSQHRQVAAVILSVMVKLHEEAANLPAEVKGRIVGPVTWEIVQSLAEYALSAGVSKVVTGSARFAHVADKLADFAKYADKFGDFGKHVRRVAEWFDEGGELRKVLNKLDEVAESLTSPARGLRGDVPIGSGMVDEFTELGKADNLAIEHGTSSSRRAFYERHRLHPNDPSSFAPSNALRANAFLDVDEVGNPTIFLRKDSA